jgi:long-chain acyl-CoA synthetase
VCYGLTEVAGVTATAAGPEFLARLDADGWLTIAARTKDVVIRGGENIATVRVEARLAEHPAVAEVAVVGLADPDLGEELAAAAVLRRGAPPTTEYDLPKNAMGKILKRQVAATWPAAWRPELRKATSPVPAE